jgi:hypothetical protein
MFRDVLVSNVVMRALIQGRDLKLKNVIENYRMRSCITRVVYGRLVWHTSPRLEKDTKFSNATWGKIILNMLS